MKKLISLMLALIMVLSLATVASAEGDLTPSKATTATIKKDYTVAGAVGDIFPAETLKFKVEAVKGNPADTMISVADHKVDADPDKITVTVPKYSTPGVYNYVITEEPGTTQGVSYNQGSVNQIGVQVLVTYNDDHTGYNSEVQVVDVNNKNEKNDTFTNNYDLGKLEVKKTISGNLASDTAKFKIKVTFNAESGKQVWSDISYTVGTETKTIAGSGWSTNSADIELKADETITFVNIPAGVTYTVVEDDSHKAEDPAKSNPLTGYTVSGEVTEAESIASNVTSKVTINNNKKTTVATGIVTDSAPYIILIAVCAVAAVAFVLKRRNAVEF